MSHRASKKLGCTNHADRRGARGPWLPLRPWRSAGWLLSPAVPRHRGEAGGHWRGGLGSRWPKRPEWNVFGYNTLKMWQCGGSSVGQRFFTVGEVPATSAVSSGRKAKAGFLTRQGRRSLGIRKDGSGTALA